jgi:glutamate carboxypeptidase
MPRFARFLILSVATAASVLVTTGPAPEAWADRVRADVFQGRAGEMFFNDTATTEIYTGTWNREGLERFGRILSAWLEEIGFQIHIESGRELDLPGDEGRRTGPLIIARRAAAPSAQKARRILLIGHYDTVFEPDSPFQEFTAANGRATGPGVADMKGGLVVMLFALRQLESDGLLDRAHWTVLLNADEEIGSLVSRESLESEARQADFGLVFEAARPNGAIVRSRRGLGQFHLRVEGVAAHAGSAHEEGRSAIRELAEKVLRIEALTDYERGVTLNVGTFRGGTKRNVVPAHAEAWIDVRYENRELGEAVREQLEHIAGEVFVKDTRTRLWGSLHRPPKVATEPFSRLLKLHAEVTRALGFDPPEPVHAGGGTDGSLTSAVGLPTLDSMGVRGGNTHTKREFVVLESLPERAAIAAALLVRLTDLSFTP